MCAPSTSNPSMSRSPMRLDVWAQRHGISTEAMVELRQLMVAPGDHELPPASGGNSESAVQAVVRLEAAKKGLRLWRNNVGVLLDQRRVPVRYGLANDSKAVNEVMKSADLIGIRPVIIAQHHMGTTIGQFVSRECKRPCWVYTGRDRESAQLAWAQLVTAMGGDAAFATGEGTL